MNTLLLLFTLITAIGIFINLRQIRKENEQIMSNQEEFNQQISDAIAALDATSNAILAEAQQIREYIEANPSVDTSALANVVERLEAQAGAVTGIFTPPASGGEGEGSGGGEEAAPVETQTEPAADLAQSSDVETESSPVVESGGGGE